MTLRLAWDVADPDDYTTTEEVREFERAEELAAFLDEGVFPTEFPPLGVIRRGDGDTLAIGMGAALAYPDDEDADWPRFTVLNYAPAGGGPPTYTSRGDGVFEGEFAYFFSGSESEFGGEAAVPWDAALEVVKNFAASHGRPEGVEWEQD